MTVLTQSNGCMSRSELALHPVPAPRMPSVHLSAEQPGQRLLLAGRCQGCSSSAGQRQAEEPLLPKRGEHPLCSMTSLCSATLPAIGFSGCCTPHGDLQAQGMAQPEPLFFSEPLLSPKPAGMERLPGRFVLCRRRAWSLSTTCQELCHRPPQCGAGVLPAGYKGC